VGLNVDYQSIDWTTLVQRRIKMDPIDQGGWNVFVINDNGINEVNPAGHLWLRGNGKAAPPGWPTSAKLEEYREEWFNAKDFDAQKAAARKLQLQAFEDVPYIPLGQSIAPTAYRSDIKGVLNGQPTFWNVRRG
jgi:peptide/nickel transport system substrate-binding protein